MRGLELSREFYLAYGKAALEKDFSDVADRIAVGLVGEGSECFGFDDSLSCDHDFEAGFCLWLTREDYEKFGFSLERMYRNLPKEFMGYHRLPLSPVGGNRHGVMIIDDFYSKYLGSPTLPMHDEEWFYIPHEALAVACNGEVFCDGLGEFSKIRNTLLSGYPRDVLLKKIAANAAMMSQSGLYNYERCVKRGESGAAQLCVFEFVKHGISLVYLLNNRYEPFYKWAYRGMRELPRLSELESTFVSLTELGNSKIEAEAKAETVRELCEIFTEEFKAQGLTDTDGKDFEKHVFSIQNNIKNPTIRNMHIMDGI